MEYLIFFYS